jgi:PAS domain S-box-containing protein
MNFAIIISYLVLISIGTFLFLQYKKAKKKNANELEEREKKHNELQDVSSGQIQSLKKALEEAEHLAIVTRQSENAVMLMDPKGNILWINNSFTRMYEYSYDEFIKALGSNIRQTSFSSEINDRLYRCSNLKQPVTYEALNITKTGKQIWTHTSLTPLLSENDEVVGLVTTDSDIHKRVMAGEDLINHIMSFNQKVEKISEQLNVMVELTDILFEGIEKSQQRINRTDQIVGFVKGISDQTKLLGINASIEAHSAGDHGRGFRVIANEMVTVSNLTIESLKEINDLISSVKKSSDHLGSEKERSEQAISAHRSLITELKRQINEVESVVSQISK